MEANQIFDDSFEGLWAKVDRALRDHLLDSVRKMGSMYRLTATRAALNAEMGLRFYDALEHALSTGSNADKLLSAKLGPIPASFDEVIEEAQRHPTAPFHAFVLLVLYARRHPLRAFFSGRDELLPYNTLTVRVTQAPTDALPTAVGYGLSSVALDRCPASTYEPASLLAEDPQPKPPPLPPPPPFPRQPHPKNHWIWKSDDTDPPFLIWVWHF